MAELSYVLPTPSPVCAGLDNANSYEIELASLSEGNSKWVLIPDDVSFIVVTVSFADGGRGKIQTTTDITKRVKSNNDVIAVDWDLGVVDNTIQDAVKSVTAFRLVQTSATGSCRCSMRAR